MMDRPLSIGMLCYPTYGGSGAVAAEIGRHLARRGHTVHFISYSKPFRLAGDEIPNVHFHKIHTMEYPLFLGALYSMSASVGVYDVIRGGGVDLLHVHYALPHAICAFLAMEMLPPERRIPTLTTLHGTDITLIGNSPSFQPAVKLGLDKSDGLTCVSQWLSDRTCEHFDICDRLNVIHNFIDAEFFRPDRAAEFVETPRRPGEALLAHVSNLRPVKRVGDVIRVLAEVNRSRPARLLLVGDGPDREGALRLAGELGVADRVEVMGEREDVAPYLAASDLLLFPSDGESFGLAAAESMACGVPVIGALAGGLPEVVVDGEHGALLPVGDIQGMAAAALRILADEPRRREMGMAGRARVIEKFSPDLIIPQYERLYASMLRRRAGAVAGGIAGGMAR